MCKNPGATTDDLKETKERRGYCKLKEEPIDRILWRIWLGRISRLVVTQNCQGRKQNIWAPNTYFKPLHYSSHSYYISDTQRGKFYSAEITDTLQLTISVPFITVLNTILHRVVFAWLLLDKFRRLCFNSWILV